MVATLLAGLFHHCSDTAAVDVAQGVMHYYGAAFLMWELSTPLMYVR